MITKKLKLKQWQNIFRDCKCKLNSTTCNSKQQWSNKTCQYEYKNYCKCKENYSGNPSIRICENSKYLKSVSDTSVTKCDEIVIPMNIASTKKTNTIATNVTSAASIYWQSKKVRDCYILHTVLLAIILILIILTICHHYAKQ